VPIPVLGATSNNGFQIIIVSWIFFHMLLIFFGEGDVDGIVVNGRFPLKTKVTPNNYPNGK
jgi:hypothetical protein